jgi:uncharacterized protein
MKLLLLWFIKLYWILIPKNKRRTCLFRVSCSKHVYQTTKRKGLRKGLLAFKYRFENCRSGVLLHENPIDGKKMMILPNNQVLIENEISERIIKPQ